MKKTRKKPHAHHLDKDVPRQALQDRQRTTDEFSLKQEVPEEFREPLSDELNPPRPDTAKNLSQGEDRSEDLINETDPFIQQPEKDTQIPPELIQQRAYRLYEQRRGKPGDDLADWFEAERQIREERHLRRK